MTDVVGRMLGNRHTRDRWKARKAKYFAETSQWKYGKPYDLLSTIEKNEVQQSWYEVIEKGLAGEYD